MVEILRNSESESNPEVLFFLGVGVKYENLTKSVTHRLPHASDFGSPEIFFKWDH